MRIAVLHTGMPLIVVDNGYNRSHETTQQGKPPRQRRCASGLGAANAGCEPRGARRRAGRTSPGLAGTIRRSFQVCTARRGRSLPGQSGGVMTRHWAIADMPWQRLAPDLVDVELLETVKTAALIEANSADYVTYLHNVFGDDPEFKAAADVWGVEEAQHGAALARWAERVDPTFDFAASLAHFRAGYRLPLTAVESVRGSRAGELVARCVVESGTCSFYSALRDSTHEPVLRQICHHIAQDEAAHYRLFQTHLRRYLHGHPLGFWARLKVALGRLRETSDDELAYAYFSANHAGRDCETYARSACANAYWRRAMGRYQRRHVQSATHMILSAVDLEPGRAWVKWAVDGVWFALHWRLQRLQRSSA